MIDMKKKSNKAFSLVEVLIAVGMIAALFGAFFLILSQARNMTVSLREKQRMSWVLKYEASQIQNFYVQNEELPKLDTTYINRLIDRHKFPKFITKFRLNLSQFKTGDFNNAFVLKANWKQKGKALEQALKFNFTQSQSYLLPAEGDL